MNELTMKEMLEMRFRFHRLWTAAVGTHGYDKEEWKSMEAVLDRAFDQLTQREHIGSGAWMGEAQRLAAKDK